MSGRIRVGNTNLALMRGDEDVREWSDEELIRGQRRAKNGKWAGRPPGVVPKVVHDELVRRKLSKAYELMNDNLNDAVALLGEIVRDPTAENRDRLKAADMIIDRVMPKQIQPIALVDEPEPRWAAALRSVYEGSRLHDQLVRSVGEPIETTASED